MDWKAAERAMDVTGREDILGDQDPATSALHKRRMRVGFKILEQAKTLKVVDRKLMRKWAHLVCEEKGTPSKACHHKWFKHVAAKVRRLGATVSLGLASPEDVAGWGRGRFAPQAARRPYAAPRWGNPLPRGLYVPPGMQRPAMPASPLVSQYKSIGVQIRQQLNAGGEVDVNLVYAWARTKSAATGMDVNMLVQRMTAKIAAEGGSVVNRQDAPPAPTPEADADAAPPPAPPEGDEAPPPAPGDDSSGWMNFTGMQAALVKRISDQAQARGTVDKQLLLRLTRLRQKKTKRPRSAIFGSILARLRAMGVTVS